MSLVSSEDTSPVTIPFSDHGGTNAAASSSPWFVTSVHPNDVLMGRGAPAVQHLGNIRLREELVAPRKKEYGSTNRQQTKCDIAREILNQVVQRNGRFLCKIKSPHEARSLGVPEGTDAYTIATDEAAIEKIKQALRDKDPPITRKASRIQTPPRNGVVQEVARPTTSHNQSVGVEQPNTNQPTMVLMERATPAHNGSVVPPQLAHPNLLNPQQGVVVADTSRGQPIDHHSSNNLAMVLMDGEHARQRIALALQQRQAQQQQQQTMLLSSLLRQKLLAQQQEQQQHEQRVQLQNHVLQQRQMLLQSCGFLQARTSSLPSLRHNIGRNEPSISLTPANPHGSGIQLAASILSRPVLDQLVNGSTQRLPTAASNDPSYNQVGTPVFTHMLLNQVAVPAGSSGSEHGEQQRIHDPTSSNKKHKRHFK